VVKSRAKLPGARRIRLAIAALTGGVVRRSGPASSRRRRGAVLSFSVDAGCIVAVDVVRNPDELRDLDFLAAEEAPQSKRSTKAFSSR
jgi:hypothetical protein